MGSPLLKERLFKTQARTKNKTARAIQTQARTKNKTAQAIQTQARAKNKTARAIQTQWQRDQTKQTKLCSKSQTENKTEYKLVK